IFCSFAERCASGFAAFSSALRSTVSFQTRRLDAGPQKASLAGIGFAACHREQTWAYQSTHGSMDGSTSEGSRGTRGGAPGTTGAAGGALADAPEDAACTPGSTAAFGAPAAGATCVCAQPSTARQDGTAHHAVRIQFSRCEECTTPVVSAPDR